jgi:hypothetical protein
MASRQVKRNTKAAIAHGRNLLLFIDLCTVIELCADTTFMGIYLSGRPDKKTSYGIFRVIFIFALRIKGTEV